MLNASNARRYRLELTPSRPAAAPWCRSAPTGGCWAAPSAHDAIEIGAGGALRRGRRLLPLPGRRRRSRWRNRLGSGTTAAVMQLPDRRRRATDDSAVPARLVDASSVWTRRARRRPVPYAFRDQGDEGWTINGLPFDPMRADATPGWARWRSGGSPPPVNRPAHGPFTPRQRFCPPVRRMPDSGVTEPQEGVRKRSSDRLGMDTSGPADLLLPLSRQRSCRFGPREVP